MILALSVVRHADEQFANPVTTPLGTRCTIGRGQECDVVLEDPTRHVSRKHATIVRQGENYLLAVESRINPVILNGQPISAGQQAAVNLGDRLIIGEYEFNVVAASADQGAQAPAAADPLASLGSAARGPVDLDALFGPTPSRPASAAPAAGSGLDALFGAPSARAADPLLDILGGSGGDRAAPDSPAAHGDDPLMHILGAEASGTPAARGNADDFLRAPGTTGSIDDLLGGGVGSTADPLGLSPEVPRTRSDGAFGGGTGGSLEIDHVHDVHLPLSMPSRAAPSPAPATPPVEARRRSAQRTTGVAPPVPGADADPLAALFGAEGQSGAAPPREDPLGLFAAEGPPGRTPPHEDALGLFAAPDRAASAKVADSPPLDIELTGVSPYRRQNEVQQASVAPVVSAPAATATAQARNVAPSAMPESMQGTIRAFLEGAGMPDIHIAEADADQFVRECGGTVRAAVEGIMGMLLARAKVKEELRASDRTMVASKENNALKLIETVDEALRYVFDPATRTDAFLPPPKAVADACSDLQAHEIALVAGMRAALIGAVKLFQPAAIEKKMEKAGGKSLLANKKAQLWDQFVAHYEEIEKEAEDNFDRVFGTAFLRAYQEQVRRLRG